MVWTININNNALKELKRLDKPTAKRIMDFLRNRVATLEDPRSIGEALQGPSWGKYWKYRVGDYRIISSIEDQELHILVVKVGNRRDVYRNR